jgi:hypothetical protein
VKVSGTCLCVVGKFVLAMLCNTKTPACCNNNDCHMVISNLPRLYLKSSQYHTTRRYWQQSSTATLNESKIDLITGALSSEGEERIDTDFLRGTSLYNATS